jgi:hypothetical protein
MWCKDHVVWRLKLQTWKKQNKIISYQIYKEKLLKLYNNNVKIYYIAFLSLILTNLESRYIS